MAGGESSGGSGRRAAPSLLGPRLIAGAVAAAGAFLLFHALQIHEGRGYSVVGPSTIPIFVSVGLLGLGLILAVRTTLLPDRKMAARAGAEEAATHWRTVGLLAGLLVLYAIALGPLGYIVATAVMLPLAARILGSTSLVRDMVVGALLALVLYFGFTEFLQIRLPPGILRPVL
jgi:putative tricarboxylic transport membrane protein